MASFALPLTLACPPAYSGKPLIAGTDGSTEPYSALADMWTAQGFNGSLRALANQASLANCSSLACTALVPNRNPPWEVDQLPNIFLPVQNQMPLRLSGRSQFLAIDPAGQIIYTGGFRPNGKPYLEELADGSVVAPTSLFDLVPTSAALAQAHVENTVALLQPRSGEMILDAGAGRAYARLAALAEQARRLGAEVAAYEVVPYLSQQMRQALPNLLCVCTPPFAQFLAPTLQLGRNYVFAMQNILSALSADGVAQWLKTAQSVGARRLLLSQQNAFNSGAEYWCSLWPDEHAGFRTQVANIAQKSLRLPDSGRISERDAEGVVSLASTRAATGFASALAALHLIKRAEATEAFRYHRIVREVCRCEVAGPEAGKYVLEFGGKYPAQAELLKAGVFNTIVRGPIGKGALYEHRPFIPSGTLCIEIHNIHIVLDRDPLVDPLPQADASTRFVDGSLADFICLPDRPFINACDLLLQSGEPRSPNDFRGQIEAGVILGWRWNTDVLGAQVESPFLVPLDKNYGTILDDVRERLSRVV